DPAYSYDVLVISCTYNAATCNSSDIFSVMDPNYGRCIQFNSNEEQGSSRAGPLYGLTMTIRTDQSLYIPWTDSSGMVVAIHNKSDLPYPDVNGLYAPPGVASSFGIKYIDTTRQSAPYGDCSTEGKVKMTNFDGEYQAEACFRSCTQDEIMKQCGCYYAGFGPLERGREMDDQSQSI
ncbi:hypothetical protein PENTCL1PPCAC_17395, partial [Pristionchus entomophagus]